MMATVYVFNRIGISFDRLAVPLKICRDRAEAFALADAVRYIFGCPVWLADFEQPADARTIAHRASKSD
jgi:hypothetical protein